MKVRKEFKNIINLVLILITFLGINPAGSEVAECLVNLISYSIKSIISIDNVGVVQIPLRPISKSGKVKDLTILVTTEKKGGLLAENLKVDFDRDVNSHLGYLNTLNNLQMCYFYQSSEHINNDRLARMVSKTNQTEVYILSASKYHRDMLFSSLGLLSTVIVFAGILLNIIFEPTVLMENDIPNKQRKIGVF